MKLLRRKTPELGHLRDPDPVEGVVEQFFKRPYNGVDLYEDTAWLDQELDYALRLRARPREDHCGCGCYCADCQCYGDCCQGEEETASDSEGYLVQRYRTAPSSDKRYWRARLRQAKVPPWTWEDPRLSKQDEKVAIIQHLQRGLGLGMISVTEAARRLDELSFRAEMVENELVELGGRVHKVQHIEYDIDQLTGEMTGPSNAGPIHCVNGFRMTDDYVQSLAADDPTRLKAERLLEEEVNTPVKPSPYWRGTKLECTPEEYRAQNEWLIARAKARLMLEGNASSLYGPLR